MQKQWVPLSTTHKWKLCFIMEIAMRKAITNQPIIEETKYDNTIALQPDIENIKEEIAGLFKAGKYEFFEDGMESRFSKGLISAIEKYDVLAIEIISNLILSEKVSPEVASEALRWIGKIEHNATYENRLYLLEQSLKCSSARVRDGAGLGISNQKSAVASISKR